MTGSNGSPVRAASIHPPQEEWDGAVDKIAPFFSGRFPLELSFSRKRESLERSLDLLIVRREF
jgi:hypothetical protein